MKNPSLSPTPAVLSVKLRAIKYFKAVHRHPHLPWKAFIGKCLLVDPVVVQAEFTVAQQTEQRPARVIYHLDASQPVS